MYLTRRYRKEDHLVYNQRTMIKKIPLLTTLIALWSAQICLADVQFSSPTSGSKITGGSTLEIAWKESGTGPAISGFTVADIVLCIGSNASPLPLTTLASQVSVSLGKFQSTVPVGIGGNGKYYFLKMISTVKAGGIDINWSDRFTMAGMTGTFATPPNPNGDSSPPAAQAPIAVPAAGGAGGAFAVPYAQQTGPIRYAPMQPRPGTMITAKSYSMQFPTSAYSVYTTFAGLPNAQTTQTASPTYAVTSLVNTAAPASKPTPDTAYQKYLKRWLDEEDIS